MLTLSGTGEPKTTFCENGFPCYWQKLTKLTTQKGLKKGPKSMKLIIHQWKLGKFWVDLPLCAALWLPKQHHQTAVIYDLSLGLQ
jgi:hypothetical protein